jgi:hypothetical protein
VQHAQIAKDKLLRPCCCKPVALLVVMLKPFMFAFLLCLCLTGVLQLLKLFQNATRACWAACNSPLNQAKQMASIAISAHPKLLLTVLAFDNRVGRFLA